MTRSSDSNQQSNPNQEPNPRHEPNHRIKKAVALRYAPDQKKAPTVIAKGKGQVAESILARAKEAGVPVQEDASLVEILSKLDIDQEIPPELYQLVAEILSFIYRSDRKAKEWRSRA